MKKILILLIVLLSFGCSKEESTIAPIYSDSTPQTEKKLLIQNIKGDVATDYSYQLRIYEDFGDGNFQKTITNEYTLNSFPKIYEDEINRPFYFEVVLHNSSVYSNGGKGYVNVIITYKGDSVLFLEADEDTWSKNYTSPTYNN